MVVVVMTEVTDLLEMMSVLCVAALDIGLVIVLHLVL